MRILIAALAALLAAAVPGTAHAEERILDFDSHIQLLSDGTVDVTENILVKVENVAINHGIYRDFPTRYDGPRGQRIKIGFTLVETRLDGQQEPFKREPIGNGVRIRIGSAERTVPPGEHRYTIRYRATRELGRFDEYDELYWNVTGNGWDFAIDRAAVTVNLPVPANFGRRSFYTGLQGSTEQAARVIEESPGMIRIAATRPLAPAEGLTVAVAFPKGIIAEPPTTSRLAWFLSDWGPPLVGAVGLAALLAYLYYAWQMAGRDPRPGTVVPLFSPPDDLSPAAMRYLVEQKFDNRAFAAALVDAAIKGHIRIVDTEGGFFSSTKRQIVRVDDPQAQPLFVPERAALDALVLPGESIEMEQANHSKFSSAIKSLSDNFEEKYEDHAFRRNHGWAAAALMVWAAGLWATAVAVLAAEGSGNPILLLLSCGGLIVSALLFFALPARQGGGRCLLQGLAIVIGAGAILAGFPMLPMALETGRWLPFLLPALGLPLAISAFAWMSAPTVPGRAALDRIAGFKQYLSIAEGNRLDRMQAPEETLQLFERYLPYAIALKIENRWADRFSNQLAAAAVAGSSAQGFSWYSGPSSPWNDSGGFVESVGSSLASSVSSASTAPGSSSGSGGGGSSGGGGGGGGGGGW